MGDNQGLLKRQPFLGLCSDVLRERSSHVYLAIDLAQLLRTANTDSAASESARSCTNLNPLREQALKSYPAGAVWPSETGPSPKLVWDLAEIIATYKCASRPGLHQAQVSDNARSLGIVSSSMTSTSAPATKHLSGLRAHDKPHEVLYRDWVSRGADTYATSLCTSAHAGIPREKSKYLSR